MRDLPISSSAVVWTDKGLKIVSTDSCGDMIDLGAAPAARRRSKPLPESLTRLAAPYPPAPEGGAGASPTIQS